MIFFRKTQQEIKDGEQPNNTAHHSLSSLHAGQSSLLLPAAVVVSSSSQAIISAMNSLTTLSRLTTDRPTTRSGHTWKRRLLALTDVISSWTNIGWPARVRRKLNSLRKQSASAPAPSKSCRNTPTTSSIVQWAREHKPNTLPAVRGNPFEKSLVMLRMTRPHINLAQKIPDRSWSAKKSCWRILG